MQLSKDSLERMAVLKYEELANEVHTLINERGCRVDIESVKFYVAKARSYNLHDKTL